MIEQIKNLSPKLLWKHFCDISQIPHPSKKEEKIIAHVRKFGESLGLETLVDEVGSVLIRKHGTSGMKNRKTVILQGHLDMVPQKNSSTNHNFETDPLDIYIDGEWVAAKGTTLGADNGIGVAAAMAILESNNIEHGPIEALFTVDEETGMTGASGLKEGFLKGDILLNLDSEDEGELYIGCAGGVNTNIEFEYSEEPVNPEAIAYKVEVKGLKGGHSGLDINLGRGNANKIMNRILLHGFNEHGLRLASIDGGSLRNAIPREAIATITIPVDNQEKFELCIKKLIDIVLYEFKLTDPEISITINRTGLPKSIIDVRTTENLFNSISACVNGVIRMLPDMPGVVETSTNLAIVKSESGKINIATLQRSSVDSAKEDIANSVGAAFKLAGAKVIHHGDYSGWKPNLNSSILKTMKEVYNKKYGKVPEVKVIHAGLECGIIGSTSGKELDMISFGPTIRFPHSPDEKVNIKSVELFYDFLIETLKQISEK